QGRLTSGFYIRSMKVDVNGSRRTVTDIYGTFFVGGEASIWIFSFYASLYVRLGMKDGGKMEGVATFTFSFSMGIVDYDFSVTVKREQEALGGGSTSSITDRSRNDRYAPAGVDGSIITRATKTKPPTEVKTEAPDVDATTTPFSEPTMAGYLAY